MKPAWSDPDILSERRPELGIREISAAQVDAKKPGIFAADPAIRPWYLQSYVEVGGLQSFISSPSNYPYLGGGSPNLYQCFVDLSFRLTAKSGYAALIHQDAHLSEPRLKQFRATWLHRIARHYNFRNEITTKMFSEVNHSEVYSANIYRGHEGPVGFDHISGLFLPSTIDECYEHDGIGPVPSTKANGTWNTKGHLKKIVRIDVDVLALMAAVSVSDEDDGDVARFIYLQSTDATSVLKAFASATPLNKATVGRFSANPMWHEGVATKKKRLMRVAGTFVELIDQLILKSPCIYVGNPLYKTPDENCSAKEQFKSIDLQDISDDYIPRTNFVANIKYSELYMQSPGVAWSETLKHVDHFRVAFRGMVQSARERTLAAALIPPGVHHVDAIESMGFETEGDLLNIYPLMLSLPYDYLIKLMQVEKIRDSVLRGFPFAQVSDTAKSRALRLACLTTHYANIWNWHASELDVLPWSHDDQRLSVETPHNDLSLKQWSRRVAIRSDFARRLALIEIDVLVAQAFGLTVDQLVEMYRTQFYVLDENEHGTWYDKNGRIVWTCSKGLTGLGFRKLDGKSLQRRNGGRALRILMSERRLNVGWTSTFSRAVQRRSSVSSKPPSSFAIVKSTISALGNSSNCV